MGLMRCRAYRYIKEKIMISRLETMSKQGAMRYALLQAFRQKPLSGTEIVKRMKLFQGHPTSIF